MTDTATLEERLGRQQSVLAARAGLVLMTDHTYCYTAAVRRVAKAVHAGDLGEIQYIDSVRINLGLVQRDVDVMWDLAPHDISILDFVLPEGEHSPMGTQVLAILLLDFVQQRQVFRRHKGSNNLPVTAHGQPLPRLVHLLDGRFQRFFKLGDHRVPHSTA